VRGNIVKIKKISKLTTQIEKATGMNVPKIPPPVKSSPKSTKKK